MVFVDFGVGIILEETALGLMERVVIKTFETREPSTPSGVTLNLDKPNHSLVVLAFNIVFSFSFYP